MKKIAKVYSELRKVSIAYAGIRIAIRHFESTIRIAEAHAKMHFREFVSSDDVDFAIKVLVESFVRTQKYGTQQALLHKLRRFITYHADLNDLSIFVLRQ